MPLAKVCESRGESARQTSCPPKAAKAAKVAAFGDACTRRCQRRGNVTAGPARPRAAVGEHRRAVALGADSTAVCTSCERGVDAERTASTAAVSAVPMFIFMSSKWLENGFF
eukprot:3647836-Prymnesium_polylepis.1